VWAQPLLKTSKDLLLELPRLGESPLLLVADGQVHHRSDGVPLVPRPRLAVELPLLAQQLLCLGIALQLAEDHSQGDVQRAGVPVVRSEDAPPPLEGLTKELLG